MYRLGFSHPEPLRSRLRILPVFLPYHGCPHRCMYCAQHLQTGVGAPTLNEIHARMSNELTLLAENRVRQLGVAFYGGTFTALPEKWQKRFLDGVRPHRESGMVVHLRCSTRPDRIQTAHLQWLRCLGLEMVELGIQSFDQTVLHSAGRGYDAQTALQACTLVRESGLQLGIQLMPGLPSSTTMSWFRDVHQTASLTPEVVRIYPCLVLRDTPLADALHKGTYRPWSLPVAIWAVSQALLTLWRKKIPVIRIGLAPEADLFKAILGGPWHPAFGHRAKSHALRTSILQSRATLPDIPLQLSIPRRFASEFWGHCREHAQTWLHHGLSQSDVQCWEHPFFLFRNPREVGGHRHGRNRRSSLAGEYALENISTNALTPQPALCNEMSSTFDDARFSLDGAGFRLPGTEAFFQDDNAADMAPSKDIIRLYAGARRTS